ncbi:TonB-dependent receptor plug domain-containing protein [Shewanella fodinae]|uniref:TonB-dependent receptor plug domain-containing protein n=1 Tax=Shewanella fodinae TaxID=552357 RepID=UPI001673C512|nr:TonB-dependent receptor [Shewanella fodinae]MCL2906498.1 TonB-dependent receptor [Shewanella fodinae]GGY93645.1 ligand-gated channel [Shewanella fodinae]
MKGYNLVALAIAGQLVVPAVSAADDTNNSSIEKISVVGSRIALRSATDSVAPVDIITADQLQATGLTETARALQFAAPSYSFPFSAVTDGSDAVRPANLRGLSPDHTLVLVNGKRYHSSALVHLSGTVGKGASNVDLNTIPMSAIKRIEILRDGASAQYGSDAIAGVINVVLKDAREGGTLTTQLGQTYQGDGEQWRVGANKGISFSRDGFVNVSLEAQHKNSTNRAGLDPRQQYPLRPDGSEDPREATFNRKNHQVGDAEYDNVSLFANAAQYFGDSGKLYGYAGYSQRETKSGAFYRRALDSRNVLEVYPDGFLPELAPKIKDYSALLGYEFDWGKWHLDSSAGYGKNSFNYRVENSINASLGTTSPTTFDAGTLATDEYDLTLDGSRYFDFFNDSEIMLALGAAWRQNGYQIQAGEEASYATGDYQGKPGGSQGFSGFTPESAVDEQRHNTAIYAELENQLTEDFYWSAAARYEDYSDFGDKISWKLATRYDFTEHFAVRATANTGFRAPSVQQLYFTNISTLFNPDPVTGDLVPTESGTFNNLSSVTQALQVGKLRPEESTSYSLGLVYTGDNGLTVTLDSYQINIDDRIVLSSSLTPADSDVVAQALAGTNAESARFFINAVDTRTRGVDLVISQRFDLGSMGDLQTNLAYAYNNTEIQDIHLPTILNGLQEQLFDHIEQVRMTDSTSHHTGSLGFTHHLGDFTTNLRLSYFGPYTITYSTEDVEYQGKTTVDLSVAYQATDNFTVTVGAQNLFDTYPQKRPADNNFNGIFVYPLTNTPFGFNGGYYFVEGRYTF